MTLSGWEFACFSGQKTEWSLDFVRKRANLEAQAPKFVFRVRRQVGCLSLQFRSFSVESRLQTLTLLRIPLSARKTGEFHPRACHRLSLSLAPKSAQKWPRFVAGQGWFIHAHIGVKPPDQGCRDSLTQGDFFIRQSLWTTGKIDGVILSGYQSYDVSEGSGRWCRTPWSPSIPC